jgi:hypothetical protein
MLIEKLYSEVIKRNIENRNLTFDLSIKHDDKFGTFNEVFKRI